MGRSHGGESRLILTSRIVRNSVVLVVLAVFGLAVLWTFMSEPGSSDTYTYSELLDDAAAAARDNAACLSDSCFTIENTSRK